SNLCWSRRRHWSRAGVGRGHQHRRRREGARRLDSGRAGGLAVSHVALVEIARAAELTVAERGVLDAVTRLAEGVELPPLVPAGAPDRRLHLGLRVERHAVLEAHVTLV